MLSRTLIAVMVLLVPAGAVLAVDAGVAAPEASESFDVVVFGEVVRTDQFPRADLPERETPITPAGLGEAVQSAAWLDPDFVMTTGNLLASGGSAVTWEAQAAALQGAMEGIGRPWYAVAGASDLAPLRTEGAGADALYREHLAPLWYAFEHRFALIVALCTNDPGPGRISAEQAAWLERTLAGSGARSVLVFAHDAMWNREGSGWEPIHELLAATGKPTTVLGSSARTYRDDGRRGTVSYYGLGPIIGDAEDLEAGGPSWPHLTLLRVRPTGATPVVLPANPSRGRVGVLPASWQSGAEVDRLAAMGAGEWASIEGRLTAEPGGAFSGTLVITITNPTDQRARYAVTSASSSGVALSPRRVDGVLDAGASVAWEVEGTGGTLGPRKPGDEFRVRLEYPMANGEQASAVTTLRAPIAQRLGEEAGAAATDPQLDGALSLNGRSAIELDVRPAGAFTVEAWVLAEQPRDRSAVISCGDATGYGIAWMYAGEDPRPVGYVHAGGEGHALATAGAWSWDRWSHVALVYDGAGASFFVNGRLQARREGVGAVADRGHPIVIGARPIPGGRHDSWFTGMIDEVRVSDVARYEGDFEPQRVLTRDDRTVALLHFDSDGTPLGADDSGRANHGWEVGSPVRVTPSGR